MAPASAQFCQPTHELEQAMAGTSCLSIHIPYAVTSAALINAYETAIVLYVIVCYPTPVAHRVVRQDITLALESPDEPNQCVFRS